MAYDMVISWVLDNTDILCQIVGSQFKTNFRSLVNLREEYWNVGRRSSNEFVDTVVSDPSERKAPQFFVGRPSDKQSDHHRERSRATESNSSGDVVK